MINGVTKNQYEYFVKIFPKVLHTFIVASMAKIEKNSKVEVHGMTCIFVGYVLSHDDICCHMYSQEIESLRHEM